MKRVVLVLISVLVFGSSAVSARAGNEGACDIPVRLEVVSDREMAGKVMLDFAVKVGYIPTEKVLKREYAAFVPGQSPREVLPFPFVLMTEGEIAPVKVIVLAESGMYVFFKSGAPIREVLRIKELLVGWFDSELEGDHTHQR